MCGVLSVHCHTALENLYLKPHGHHASSGIPPLLCNMLSDPCPFISDSLIRLRPAAAADLTELNQNSTSCVTTPGSDSRDKEQFVIVTTEVRLGRGGGEWVHCQSDQSVENVHTLYMFTCFVIQVKEIGQGLMPQATWNKFMQCTTIRNTVVHLYPRKMHSG